MTSYFRLTETFDVSVDLDLFPPGVHPNSIEEAIVDAVHKPVHEIPAGWHFYGITEHGYPDFHLHIILENNIEIDWVDCIASDLESLPEWGDVLND